MKYLVRIVKWQLLVLFLVRGTEDGHCLELVCLWSRTRVPSRDVDGLRATETVSVNSTCWPSRVLSRTRQGIKTIFL